MKTYKERTESILQKTKKKRIRRRLVTHSAVTAIALSVVTALNLFLFLPYETPSEQLQRHEGSEYYEVMRTIDRLSTSQNDRKPKNNFEKYLKDFFSNFSFGCAGADKSEGTVIVPEDTDTAVPPTTSEGYVSEGYVEMTDNQVAGVIEGDLFKRTNTHIFYLDTSALEIRAYSIAGEDSEEVGTISVSDESRGGYMQMYLSADGDTLTLVREVSIDAGMTTRVGERFTCVVGYDVSNPAAMTKIGEKYLTGQFISARMTGNELLLFNNFYVANNYDFDKPRTFLPHYGSLENLQPIAGEDIICPEGGLEKRYTVACSIDLERMQVDDCTALFSYSTGVYVSAQNIFLTREYTDYAEVEGSENIRRRKTKTEISCIEHSGEGLEYKGSFAVEGEVKNQYSMDEYEGVLRVVTTNWERTEKKSEYNESWYFSDQAERAGSLFCIDLTTFQTVASVEKFIEDETVESVRFNEEKVSVCTAEVVTFTDPVFIFDLRDLNDITYTDTGVIAGYSTSLVDFTDGYFVGVGYDGNRNLKIELYEERENCVEQVCDYTLKADFSEEYKSYYINREEGLIGLCVNPADGKNDDVRYILLGFDGYGWQEVANIEVGAQNGQVGYMLADVRATIVEDVLYLFAPTKVEEDNGFFVQALR